MSRSKHITYREKRNDYYLQLSKDGRHLNLAFNTIDEAIDARDRAIEFYDQFGLLPTRNDLKLKTRERRMKNQPKLSKYIILDASCSKRPYRLRVSKDSQIFLQNLETLEKAIERREEVLKFYDEHGRIPNREEQERIFGVRFKTRRYNKSSKSQSLNSGYRNISFNVATNRYYVAIRRKSRTFAINVDTLEEAISVRDEVLRFYDKHSRLPTKREYRESLKKGTIS